jgi:hypothetical protein
MPNIIITEGLDTPWELKNTESEITAATDLESINLANQVVGTLAYTASQLFSSLKTEKNNLDNIVDAIELISEEIALFPERIAKWDTPYSGLDKVDVSVFTNPFSFFDIAFADDVTGTDLSKATLNTIGIDGRVLNSQELERNRKIIDSVAALISAKPLLEAQNFSYSTIGAAVLVPPEQSPFGRPTWLIYEPIFVEGTTPGTGGNPGDLVVYRDESGKPISYEGPGNPRVTLTPDQVNLFYKPKDAAERDLMQAAINNSALIEATNALSNTTGLPAGVTPPVTTLAVNVEKYYDSARYEMTEYIRDADSIIPVPSQNKTMYGPYPPLLRPDLDLRKMTQADVGKFFQKSVNDSIYYIAEVRTNGQVVVREASEFFGGITKFISKMPDDLKKTLRGEYAEKQILLTQRGTDQTLFVTSITQRYTTFSDTATNLLKTLMNFYNDLARNIRG